MELGTLIYAASSMAGLGLAFSGLLAIANRKLNVAEDPRVAKVNDLLPAANCGSCGYAGCANFAENLVLGKTTLKLCPVCDKPSREEISKLLGVEEISGDRKVAVIMCRATSKNRKKGRYVGIQTCLAASLVSGGERACNYGCIGSGDCAAVCPFDALHMIDGLPVVDRKKCTGCNKCVEGCPRQIIELHPISRHVFVLCKNRERGRSAKDSCSNACIGCGLCVKAVGGAGIQLLNNLAAIDYDVYTKDIVVPTDRCPTNSIQIVGHEGEE